MPQLSIGWWKMNKIHVAKCIVKKYGCMIKVHYSIIVVCKFATSIKNMHDYKCVHTATCSVKLCSVTKLTKILSTKPHFKNFHSLYNTVKKKEGKKSQWLCWLVYILLSCSTLFKVGLNFQKSFRHLDFCRTSIVSLREKSSTYFWWVVWFK